MLFSGLALNKECGATAKECQWSLEAKKVKEMDYFLGLLAKIKWWLRRKASVYNVGDLGSIPGSGKFPGEGNGNPLQYSCLENPMDGGAWCPWGRKELDTTERLHFFFFQKEHSPTHTWILAQTPILDFGPLEVSASAFVLF